MLWESLYRRVYGTRRERERRRDNQCCVFKKKKKTKTQTLTVVVASTLTLKKDKTSLDVSGGAEDVESLQSHADGSQLTVQPLQTIL